MWRGRPLRRCTDAERGRRRDRRSGGHGARRGSPLTPPGMSAGGRRSRRRAWTPGVAAHAAGHVRRGSPLTPPGMDAGVAAHAAGHGRTAEPAPRTPSEARPTPNNLPLVAPRTANAHAPGYSASDATLAGVAEASATLFGPHERDRGRGVADQLAAGRAGMRLGEGHLPAHPKGATLDLERP